MDSSSLERISEGRARRARRRKKKQRKLTVFFNYTNQNHYCSHTGPKDTPYEEGFFVVDIELGEEKEEVALS